MGEWLVGDERRAQSGGAPGRGAKHDAGTVELSGGNQPVGRVVAIVGARTHNLQDVSIDIPLEQCTLIVGPSGSGKSSLAFGTIHAAAHAAYLEGISSYARFAETRLATPEVDAIYGLRPTIALAQGYGGRSSRSTVGTAPGSVLPLGTAGSYCEPAVLQQP
jgi:hypothetical protein